MREDGHFSIEIFNVVKSIRSVEGYNQIMIVITKFYNIEAQSQEQPPFYENEKKISFVNLKKVIYYDILTEKHVFKIFIIRLILLIRFSLALHDHFILFNLFKKDASRNDEVC